MGGRHALQARQTTALEHGLQFVRRPGQKHDHRAGILDPLAGSGATVVREDGGALDDEGLALVDLGHFSIGLREAALQPFRDFRGERQLAVERQGHGFARHVVFGRSQAAGDNQDRRVRQRAANGAGQPLAVVADHALGYHFDADVVQFGGEIEGVGIDAVGRQHLRAASDDFRVHRVSGKPLIPTSTRKRALVVATTMAREGVNANPTMPGPERNNSARRAGSMRTTPLRPEMEAAT
jgi:hypothetical protein